MSPDPRVARSYALWEEATRLIPGGAQLISRRPTRFAAGVSPVYAARARGARFWDVDGNEYIDWASGISAVTLGFADPEVDAAVAAVLRDGFGAAVNHPLEVELARELIATVPSAERVRFARGGGEACAMAVRIVRGVTGRDRILFCGYHGWHDWYLAANLAATDGLNEHLFPGIEPIGVPRCLEGTAVPFPYGDVPALAERLAGMREVAAVVMEPIRSEAPPPGYLAGVRELCTRHGVPLVFDEISCGFRIAPGGAQEYFDVLPDLTILGKALGNGYAIAAVAGREEWMEPAARMFISSTFWCEPLGAAAGLATLRALKSRRVSEALWSFGEELQTRLRAAAAETGCPVAVTGLPVHPGLRFDIADAELRRQVEVLYIQEMARRGCHGYTTFVLNAAQGRPELEQTEHAVREVFRVLRDALAAGTVDELLQAPVSQEPFRRLVR